MSKRHGCFLMRQSNKWSFIKRKTPTNKSILPLPRSLAISPSPYRLGLLTSLRAQKTCLKTASESTS